MNYKIYQTHKYIYVYDGDIVYLRAYIRRKWLGKIKIDIYKSETLLIKSSYYMFFFDKFCKIEYQNVEKKLSFEEKNGNGLFVDKDLYFYKWDYFKNKACIIKKNNSVLAELTFLERAKWYHPRDKPDLFNFEIFSDDNEVSLYCLIRLLITFPMLS